MAEQDYCSHLRQITWQQQGWKEGAKRTETKMDRPQLVIEEGGGVGGCCGQ